MLTFDPISLYDISTILTVAGCIQVAPCSFSWITAAFADCEKDLLWLCLAANACAGPNDVINNAAAAAIGAIPKIV
jgi:hypothetical protein